MSWFSTEKKATEAQVKAVQEKVDLIFRNTVNNVVSSLRPVEAEVVAEGKKIEADVKPVIADEKQILKGSILQALNDAKAELKNAEPGLTADAETAVDAVIKAAVEAMIKDGVEAA
jgi:hypothetical protein